MQKIKAFIFILFLGSFLFSPGQSETKRVLFLGNSYTAFNNLPLLTANVAESMGDSIIHDRNTPGGYTLEGHSSNSTSLNLINQGDWDFVVLQEQSQRPSFPISQVEDEVFPYAEQLNDLILDSSPCAETMFYMTWGRKNGDSGNCPFWPPVCTYQGMDSLLNLRYRMMADMNEAIVSPVGAVWNYIRTNYPDIELYNPDETHPSQAGSFAAAVTHYTSMFRKDPSLIPYNYTLTELEANQIKEACKLVLFENLEEWNIGDYDLTASFETEHLGGFEYEFTNTSQNAQSVIWTVNGETSEEDVFTVDFPAIGEYPIEFQVFNLCDTLILNDTLNVVLSALQDFSQLDFTVFPNPSSDFIQIQGVFQEADLVIYDMSGKEILRRRIKSSEFISLSRMTEGNYMLELNLNGKKGVQKFQYLRD